MSRFAEYCRTKQTQYGDKFDASDLAAQFVSAFDAGNTYRVHVDFGYEKTWGYVGVTTGWKPCFILMRRRGQRGSSQTLRASDKIIATRTIS